MCFNSFQLAWISPPSPLGMISFIYSLFSVLSSLSYIWIYSLTNLSPPLSEFYCRICFSCLYESTWYMASGSSGPFDSWDEDSVGCSSSSMSISPLIWNMYSLPMKSSCFFLSRLTSICCFLSFVWKMANGRWNFCSCSVRLMFWFISF